jgi:hypothetical protein
MTITYSIKRIVNNMSIVNSVTVVSEEQIDISKSVQEMHEAIKIGISRDNKKLS